jgi:Domain of unknown function (DUF1707)
MGDADRERILALLREHYAQGRFDLDEFSRRVGVVLTARYSDEAAAVVADLPPVGTATTPGQPGPRGQTPGQTTGRDTGLPIGQRRRHAQRSAPGAAWVPTAERFRDPSTKKIMRVWIDPADLSRHYVPDDGT